MRRSPPRHDQRRNTREHACIPPRAAGSCSRAASRASIETAKREIEEAFKPFVETPDKRPRPLTVFVDIPRFVAMTEPKKRAALADLAKYVSSGKAAGKGKKAAPPARSSGLPCGSSSGPTEGTRRSPRSSWRPASACVSSSSTASSARMPTAPSPWPGCSTTSRRDWSAPILRAAHEEERSSPRREPPRYGHDRPQHVGRA